MQKEFSIRSYIASHSVLAQSLDVDGFQRGIEIIRYAFEKDKKIITCGNGGSASTASHYITDWNKMVNLATKKKFRGISLTDNVGLVTAFGNDFEYEHIFSGQLESLMDEGDLLVAISGSGNSPNVCRAAKTAKNLGGNVLGVVGYDGGELLPICDHSVLVNSFDMQLCEDVHLMFGHMVMKSLCGAGIKT